MPEGAPARTGRCLCGAVRFAVAGPLSDPVACHCEFCRRGSGNFTASTSADTASVSVSGEVRWYATGPTARRGFCPVCGAPLFWVSDREPGALSIEMGALDPPTGLALGRHMFAASKGDWYRIADGLPAFPRDVPRDP